MLHIDRYNCRMAPLRGLSDLRPLSIFRLFMPNYRRNLVPGGTYFFTVNLRDRKSQLLVQKVDLSPISSSHQMPSGEPLFRLSDSQRRRSTARAVLTENGCPI